MYNLIDIRKNESKLKEMNLYLNTLILFLFSITIYSYCVAFTPKYFIKQNIRVNWLTIGLISNLIAGGLSKVRLPKIEEKIEELEKDSNTHEQNNRHLIMSSSNYYLEQELSKVLNPPQPQQQDPFMAQLMQQCMNIPIVGEGEESNQPVLSSIEPEVVVDRPDAPFEFYSWHDCIDEAVGFIVSGNSGSGKTSVACWLAGLLTKEKPAQVLALDPHYNDTWEQVGIKSLGKIDQIESALMWLLSELDLRCDRKSKKLPLGDDLIIFCDEVNACLERFENSKNVESAIKRLGSEGRKFGITFILLNQSHNAGDLGVSKKYLNNYFMIALCASARAIIDENFKQNTPEKDYIKSTAYPCVVSGSVPIQIALHPTHNTYTKFKKHGNPPLNLLPINQLPLLILNQALSKMSPAIEQQQQQPSIEQYNLGTVSIMAKPVAQTQLLERSLNQESVATVTAQIACINCGSFNIKKNGTMQGKQRYLCKDCKTSFT